jgi:hypothetical protein
MFKNKLATLAVGSALFAGAMASPSIEEIKPKFYINAAAIGGLAGQREIPGNDTTFGAFSWFGLEFYFSVPGAWETAVLGMNNKFAMVGSARNGDGYVGFHRNWNGKVSKYKVPGSRDTTFNDINDDGLIFGWQYTGLDNFGTFFLDKQGNVTPFVVPGLETANWFRANNKQEVMGSLYDYPGAHGIVGALYKNGTVDVIEYPGADHTLAIDLNKQGVVLGEAWFPYDSNLEYSPVMAFLRKQNGELVGLDYQPNWAPMIKEKVDGKNRWMKFSHAFGTSARALDDSGRAIIVCSALYRAETPFGYIGVVKERTFAIRP